MKEHLKINSLMVPIMQLALSSSESVCICMLGINKEGDIIISVNSDYQKLESKEAMKLITQVVREVLEK